MKIKTKLFGALAALALLLPLGLGSGQVAKADAASTTDIPKEQTIEIHKLIFDTIPKDQKPNTGGDMNFEGSKPLSGAGFTAYDVTKEYWDAYKVDKTKAQAAALETEVTEETKYEGESKLTNEDGVTSLSLPIVSKLVGEQNAVYKIVETTTPAGADDQKAVAFLVGLPVYDKDENLLKQIKVYPKNEYRTSTLEFTKYGVDLDESKTGFAEPNALKDAKFVIMDGKTGKYLDIEKNTFSLDDEPTTDKALLSGNNGKVSVPGLILADDRKYEIYEIDSDVSKQNPEATKDEVFHYTTSPIITVTANRDKKTSKLILTYTFKDKKGKDESITATPNYDKDGTLTYSYTGNDGNGAEAYNYKVPEPTKKANDNDLDIGQTVKFTIRQLIPNDISQYDYFKLVDDYDDSLALISEPKEIKDSIRMIDADGQENKADGLPITMTRVGDNSKFELAFDTKKLEEFKGKILKLEVKMKILPGANLESDINNKVTFDNNFFPKTKTATVKTYGKTFVKKDLVSGKTLAGAEFVVQRGNKFLKFIDKNQVSWVENTLTFEDGKAVWGNSEADAIPTSIVSENDGTFSVSGLAKTDKDDKDIITYQLVETKAPEGYVLAKDPINFEADNGSTTFTVNNKSKGTLPSTGGKGIYAFIAIGTIAVVGAVFYFTRGRKQTEA